MPDAASPASNLATQFFKTSKRTALALALAAMMVEFYTAFASEKTLDTQTCEKILKQLPNTFPSKLRATFIEDYGLFYFYLSLLSRLGIIPFMEKMGNQVAQCLYNRPMLSKETKKLLGVIQEEVIDALSLAVLARQLSVATPVKYLYGMAAGFPLLRFGARKYCPHYPETPSWPALKGTMDSKSAIVIASGEALFTGAKLGSSAGASLLRYFVPRFMRGIQRFC